MNALRDAAAQVVAQMGSQGTVWSEDIGWNDPDMYHALVQLQTALEAYDAQHMQACKLPEFTNEDAGKLALAFSKLPKTNDEAPS